MPEEIFGIQEPKNNLSLLAQEVDANYAASKACRTKLKSARTQFLNAEKASQLADKNLEDSKNALEQSLTEKY